MATLTLPSEPLSQYQVVQVTPEEFLSTAMLCEIMAVDTETNGKDIRDGRGYAIGISASVFYGNIFYKTYFPVAHSTGNVTDEIKELLFNIIRTRKAIIFHNAKFDLVSLETAGYRGGYIKWYCTMLMAHMCNENLPSKGLDWLARNELKEGGKEKPQEWLAWFAIYGWSPDFPAEVMAIYAGQDAVLTLMLFFRIYPAFVKSGFDGSEMFEVRTVV